MIETSGYEHPLQSSMDEAHGLCAYANAKQQYPGGRSRIIYIGETGKETTVQLIHSPKYPS